MIILGTIEELGPLPEGTIAQRIDGGRVEIVGPDQNGIIAALPARAIAEIKRAEIRAAKETALTLAIGGDTDIRLAMSQTDELINARHDRELTAEEAQMLGVFQAAQDVAELIAAKQDALLAAIDAAEAAGDIPALLAISWG